MRLALGLPSALALVFLACSGTDSATPGSSTSDAGTPVTSLPEGGGGSSDGATTDGATGSDASGVAGDPDADGPFATAEKDATATVASTATRNDSPRSATSR